MKSLSAIQSLLMTNRFYIAVWIVMRGGKTRCIHYFR